MGALGDLLCPPSPFGRIPGPQHGAVLGLLPGAGLPQAKQSPDLRYVGRAVVRCDEMVPRQTAAPAVDGAPEVCHEPELPLEPGGFGFARGLRDPLPAPNPTDSRWDADPSPAEASAHNDPGVPQP